jgi:hypothetical protein
MGFLRIYVTPPPPPESKKTKTILIKKIYVLQYTYVYRNVHLGFIIRIYLRCFKNILTLPANPPPRPVRQRKPGGPVHVEGCGS